MTRHQDQDQDYDLDRDYMYKEPKPDPEKTAEESVMHMMADPTDTSIAYAADYIRSLGVEPTPDAVDQLAGPFSTCLRIMCKRGYEPNGQLWKQSGLLGVMTDVKKKFDRFWYRTWTLGIRHDDSGYDLINFTGMALRSDPDSRFGNLGEPAMPGEKASDEHYE